MARRDRITSLKALLNALRNNKILGYKNFNRKFNQRNCFYKEKQQVNAQRNFKYKIQVQFFVVIFFVRSLVVFLFKNIVS